MMKKIIIISTLCISVVEQSHALIPQLRYAARLRAQQTQGSIQDVSPTQKPTPTIQPTCEMLINLCAALGQAGVTTKDSPEFKQFTNITMQAIEKGALTDCLQKPALINAVSDALDVEVDTPETALANEIFKELVDGVRQLEAKNQPTHS